MSAQEIQRTPIKDHHQQDVEKKHAAEQQRIVDVRNQRLGEARKTNNLATCIGAYLTGAEVQTVRPIAQKIVKSDGK